MFLNLTKTTLIAGLVAAPIAVAVATAAPFPRMIGPVLPEIAADPSVTETFCDARAAVGDTLREDFAEEPRLAAITGAGMTMELWASDLMGTWTVVHHGTDGITCILSSGTDWTTKASAVELLDEVLAREVHQS